MASRHFSVKHGKVGRGKKHAQYIGGQANYADKDDVVFLLDVNMPNWARDGIDFFDAADKLERANGRTYTEFEFAIPREIENPVAYAQKLAIKLLGKNHPYRLAVHDKLASDGGRNTHGHLMFTERKLDRFVRDIDHFFLRANSKDPEKGGAAKDRKWNAKDMVETMRQEYSLFAKSYGVELDLRSNLAQGLSDPEPKIGPVHDRANKNINRDNLVSRVEKIRIVRSADATLNSEDQKLKYASKLQAQSQRKYLWAEFQKQRKATYLKLVDDFKASKHHEKEKRNIIKTKYLQKRELLNNDRNIKFSERRIALSIIHMERISQELAIKAEFETIRSTIKSEQNEHYSEKYRIYLTSQGAVGNEIAKAELSRLKPAKPIDVELNSIVGIGSVRKMNPALMNFKYEIHSSGSVTYKMYGIDVIRDVGIKVDLLQTTDLSIEAGLRLAQSKFGNRLTLTGTQEFQERTARIAAEKGLKVEFVDPYLNNIMQTHSETLTMQQYLKNAEKNLIASGLKLKSIEPIDSKSQTDIKANLANLNEARFFSRMNVNESQNSLIEIAKVASNKGLEVVKPSNQKYRGRILAITSHHILQSIGKNRAVIHKLDKVEASTIFKVGIYAEINYQSKSHKASIVPMVNPKSRTR